MDYVSHPVHFVTKNRKVAPSALIPFCEFGGDMSSMGVKISEFNVPVCNKFQAKILNDQLCYEVDLNRFSNKDNIKNELMLGFVFFMDYNEDRQVTDQQTKKNEDFSLANTFVESDQDQHAFIYLDTIGKN